MKLQKKLEQAEVLIEAPIKLNDEESESSLLTNYDVTIMLKLIKEIMESVQTDLAKKKQLMFAYGLQVGVLD